MTHLTDAGASVLLSAVALDPRGSRAPTGSERAVTISSLEDGGALVQYAGHRSFVSCIAWSPDGAQLLSAGERDGCIHAFDVSSLPARAALPEPVLWDTGSKFVRSMQYTPGGSKMVTASGGHSELQWNRLIVCAMPLGTQLVVVEAPHALRFPMWASISPPPHAARASRAARRTTPCIHVFNACSGGREAVLVGHSDSVGCVAFAPLLGGGGALEGRLEAAERVGRRHAAHVVLPSGASCGGASCMRAWRWQLLKPRRLPPARPAGSRLHPLKRWELAHAPAKRCYAAAYVGICMHAGGRRRSAR